MKTGSKVKISIFFLVRGTLLILINKVLVKCYCEVFSARINDFKSVYPCVIYRCRRKTMDLKVSGMSSVKAILLFHGKFHNLGF